MSFRNEASVEHWGASSEGRDMSSDADGREATRRHATARHTPPCFARHASSNHCHVSSVSRHAHAFMPYCQTRALSRSTSFRTTHVSAGVVSRANPSRLPIARSSSSNASRRSRHLVRRIV